MDKKDGEKSMSCDNRQSTSFTDIDRKNENNLVAKFQKTRDPQILEELYRQRIPTLQIWARRYSYLTKDTGDMLGELTFHFVKAVNGYNSKKASFNTFLWSAMLHCVYNISNGQKAKKRVPEGMEGESSSKFLLSLDYNYSKQDGEESTLRDMLADEIISDDRIKDQIYLDETISILSKHDPHMKDVFVKISRGETIAAIVKESRTKRGRIKLDKVQATKLRQKRRCNRVVSNIITDTGKVQKEFKVVGYKVSEANNLHYTVEMNKTKESDAIMRSVRKLRRNKEWIKSQF